MRDPVPGFNYRLNDGKHIRKRHHQHDHARCQHRRNMGFEDHKWPFQAFARLKEREGQREEQVRQRHRHVRHQRQFVVERRRGITAKRDQQNKQTHQQTLHPHCGGWHTCRVQRRHRRRPQRFWRSLDNGLQWRVAQRKERAGIGKEHGEASDTRKPDAGRHCRFRRQMQRVTQRHPQAFHQNIGDISEVNGAIT